MISHKPLKSTCFKRAARGGVLGAWTSVLFGKRTKVAFLVLLSLFKKAFCYHGRSERSKNFPGAQLRPPLPLSPVIINGNKNPWPSEQRCQ